MQVLPGLFIGAKKEANITLSLIHNLKQECRSTFDIGGAKSIRTIIFDGKCMWIRKPTLQRRAQYLSER